MNLDDATKDSVILCEDSHGVEIHGRLVRLGWHDVTFELPCAEASVQASETLNHFRVVSHEKTIFDGQAVVRSFVNSGTTLLCQATVEGAWLTEAGEAGSMEPAQVRVSFEHMLHLWQKTYRILPEFKLAITDIQTFLHGLRNWAEQSELVIESTPAESRAEKERTVIKTISGQVEECLNTLFEKFEIIAARIEPDMQPAHGVYVRRQLHPLLLASPFLHRIFRKPLGYAGDYEMVNMILRDPLEGRSLFAKLLNNWILNQVPAKGHRNRIQFLISRLEQESLNARLRGGTLKVLNLGCGPAREVAEFMQRSELSDHAAFRLLDFNDETLNFTRSNLSAVCQRAGRKTSLRLEKQSVAQVLKNSNSLRGEHFEFIYCAGLFDYLPNRVCQQMLNLFYKMLVPGGLLIATNVDSSNPLQRLMDYIFEWHLVYRDSRAFLALAPDAAAPDLVSISADATGSNLYLEVRKPRD